MSEATSCRCYQCQAQFQFQAPPTYVQCPACTTTNTVIPGAFLKAECSRLKGRVIELEKENSLLKERLLEEGEKGQQIKEGKQEEKNVTIEKEEAIPPPYAAPEMGEHQPIVHQPTAPIEAAPIVQVNPTAFVKSIEQFPQVVVAEPHPQEEQAQPDSKEPKEAKEKVGKRLQPFQIVLIVAVGLVALFALIFGLVLLFARPSDPEESLVPVGVVALLISIGVIASMEFLFIKFKKQYSLLFDWVVGMAIFGLQAAGYILVTSIAYSAEDVSEASWTIAIHAVLSALLSALCWVYLAFRVPRLSPPANLKKGGPISWTLLVSTNYTIAWIGMGVWPIYFSGDFHVAIYITGSIIMLIGNLIAYESDRGFLIIICTAFTSLTYLLLDIFIRESHARVLFLLALLGGALLVHYTRVRAVWANMASLTLFVAAIAFQIYGVAADLDFSFFGADNEWEGEYSSAVYICLLAYIPALFRKRARTLPVFLALGLSFVGTPGSYIFWFIGIAALVAFALFSVVSKEGQSEKEVKSSWLIFRILCRLTSACLFVSYVIYTHLHNDTTGDRIFALLLFPFCVLTGICLDLRCSNKQWLPFVDKLKEPSDLFDSVVAPTAWDIKKCVCWTLMASMVGCGFSGLSVGEDNRPFMFTLFVIQLIVVSISTALYWKWKDQDWLPFLTAAHLSLFMVLFYLGLTSGLSIFTEADEDTSFLDISFTVLILLTFLATWKRIKDPKEAEGEKNAEKDVEDQQRPSQSNVVLYAWRSVALLRPEFLASMGCIMQLVFSTWIRHDGADHLAEAAFTPLCLGLLLLLIEAAILLKLGQNMKKHFAIPLAAFTVLVALMVRIIFIDTGSYDGLAFSLLLCIPVLIFVGALILQKKQEVGTQWLQISIVALTVLSMLDAYFGIALIIILSVCGAISILLLSSYSKLLSQINLFVLPVVFVIRIIPEALTGDNLDQLVATQFVAIFLVIWAAFMHVPHAVWTRKGSDKLLWDYYGSHPQQARYLILTILRFILLLGGLGTQVAASLWGKDLGIPFLVICVLLLILCLWLKDLVFLLAFPGLISAGVAILLHDKSIDGEIHFAVSAIAGLATAGVMFLLTLHPTTQLVYRKNLGTSEKKLTIFRETMWIWQLIFALCLATPFDAGIVSTVFFLLTISRAYWTSSILLYVATLFSILETIICSATRRNDGLDQPNSCRAFMHDSSGEAWAGIEFLILSLAIFVYLKVYWNRQDPALPSQEPDDSQTKRDRMYWCLYALHIILYVVGTWLLSSWTYGWLPPISFTVLAIISAFSENVHALWLYPLFLNASVTSLLIINDLKGVFEVDTRDYDPLAHAFCIGALFGSVAAGVLCLLGHIPWGERQLLFSRSDSSERYRHNFVDLMLLGSFAFSFVTFSVTYQVYSLVFMVGMTCYAVWRKWLIPFVLSPGCIAMGMLFVLVAFKVDSSELGWVTGLVMMVCTIPFPFLIRFPSTVNWWITEDGVKDWTTIRNILQNRFQEKRVSLMMEEFGILWAILGSILVSFTGEEITTARSLVFVLTCFGVGIMEAITGFKTSRFHQRVQGMLLLTVAVLTSAFIIDESGHIVQPILLIFGAIMIIVMIVLELYFIRAFHHLCGDPNTKEEPQDKLKKEDKSGEKVEMATLNP